MKKITLEMIAGSNRLADMCRTYGLKESGTRCPLGNEFGCPFDCRCEEVTESMWSSLAKSEEAE